MRAVAVNELLPLLLTPVGDGQTVDGEDRLPLLIGGDAHLGIFLGEVTFVHSRIHISRTMYRYLLLVHSDKGVVINAHLTEQQTDIEQEVETVEETPNETSLLLIRLDFLLLSGYGLVFGCNGILQENNLLADFGFLLF